MNAVRVIRKPQSDRIIAESVDQKRRLVLTHESPQGWRTFNSTFVSGYESARTIQVSAQIPADVVPSGIPRAGDTLGVTFRVGHKKCMFASRLTSLERFGTEMIVILPWPDQVHQLRRRAYERAKPPEGVEIPVRLYRIGVSSDSPLDLHAGVEARTVLYGQLEDLSAGGIRITVADVADYQLGSTYRCSFAPRPGKPPLVLDTLLRHRGTAEEGRATVGFQVVGLESTPEGQRVLERLGRTVTQFQRAHARKKR